MEQNGKKIEMIEDIAVLKTEVRAIHNTQKEYHDEVKSMFNKLQTELNDRTTSAYSAIASNRKLYIRLLITAMVLGSFLWIKESRDFIIHNWFRF